MFVFPSGMAFVAFLGVGSLRIRFVSFRLATNIRKGISSDGETSKRKKMKINNTKL